MAENVWMLWIARLALVAAGLAAWFWTQRLIGRRTPPAGHIGDRVHAWTARLNRGLHARPRLANALLIATSGIIDLIGLFLLAAAVFGPTFRPFVGLIILYALRQACQGLVSLPAPEGQLWRHPGFPSLLVTYGTSNDLFFSGHTAIAVYGAVELARIGGPEWALAGALLAATEAVAVLVLRAHYTMDVFAAIVAALWTASVAAAIAPAVDRALAALVGMPVGWP